MRYEIKFIFDENELSNFKDWMFIYSNFIKKYPKRIVNSIYFDDAYNSSANDNLAGISIREKYRLRWYGNKFDNLSNFEIKRKVNKLNSKIYFDLKNNYEDLIHLNNLEIANLFQKKIFKYNPKYNFNFYPKLQVQYLRRYFENNENIRLTLDSGIQFWSCPENQKSFYGYKYDYFSNIVEIKFEQKSLSYFTDLIRKTNFLPKRHSKYLAGLAILSELKYI